MTYDEYQTKITELVSNPESAAILAQDILKEIKTDTDIIASITADNQDKDAKIRSLQDTNTKLNTKLFLQMTGKPDPVEDEPSEEEKIEAMNFNEYISYLKESEEK